jgi:hypothetical protein
MSVNPTSDLVGVAWLRGISGLSAAVVSTTLPRDNTTWAATGFVTASAIGGSQDLYLPIRRPVYSVDCWAVNPNSGRPPWGQANGLAEFIRAHIEAGPRVSNFGRALTFSGDVVYKGANVIDAIMRTEPRRGPVGGIFPAGDEASYARYMFDLELVWRVGT